MVALLTGAVMFALGLFFGWLLHRERVERALYEDVVRARDRATAALAETTARLELADTDVARLRRQLVEAQHLLDAREAAIVRLEREVVSRIEPTAGAPGGDGGRPAVAGPGTPQRSPGNIAEVTAAPPPTGAPLFDQLEVDDEIDVTEEVTASRARVTADDDPDDGSAAADDAAAPAGDAGAPADDGAVHVMVPADDEGAPSDDGAVDVVAPGDDEGAPASEVDDLRRINGVGPALERLLHQAGITTFRQLALLDDAAIDHLKASAPRLVARLRSGNWVSQARRLHMEMHGDEP